MKFNEQKLSYDNPLILKNPIFIKYKVGKIYASKIIAKISNLKNIFYCITLPLDQKKIIYIKDLGKKILNFNFIKEFQVGLNQYKTFDLAINREPNDKIEIENLKIKFEVDSLETPSKIKELTHHPTMSIIENKSKKAFDIKKCGETSQIGGIENRRNAAKGNLENDFEDNTFSDIKCKEEVNFTTIKKKITNFEKEMLLPLVNFFHYNEDEKKLDKFEREMEINFDNYDNIIKDNKKIHQFLIRFFKIDKHDIKLKITFIIKHKEVNEYLEITEESILHYDVIQHFKKSSECDSKIFITEDLTNPKNQEKSRVFLINNKIVLNFSLRPKLDQDIIIKNIKLEQTKSESIKYCISYYNDILYDDPDSSVDEKDQTLLIKKGCLFSVPYEVEFSNNFEGSIGTIKINWTTKELEEFDGGKLTIINEDSYEIPLIKVKNPEFDFKYDTTKNDDNKIKVHLYIKNISDEAKYIKVINRTWEEKNDSNNFIILGMNRQIHYLQELEDINIYYELIPIGRGEFELPLIKITEKNINTTRKEDIKSYYLSSEKIINI
jgi:hypothetical protein